MSAQPSAKKPPNSASKESKFIPEDYFRVLNEYKEIYKAKEETKFSSKERDFSVILNDSPEKFKILPRDDKNLIILPRETIYMIDKVVRQRTSRGNLANKFYDAQALVENGDSPEPQSVEKPSNQSQESPSPNPSMPTGRETSSGKKRLTYSQNSSPARSAQKLTFQDWLRNKEIERRLKERLLQDAIDGCKQIKEHNFQIQQEEVGKVMLRGFS